MDCVFTDSVFFLPKFSKAGILLAKFTKVTKYVIVNLKVLAKDLLVVHGKCLDKQQNSHYNLIVVIESGRSAAW